MLVGALLLSASCGPFGSGNTNGNANANDNGNENGGTGNTVDDLPDLSDDDAFGSGEGEDAFVSGLILVGFDQTISEDLFLQLAQATPTTINGQLLDVIPDIQVISVLVQPGAEQQSITLARQLENVDYAEAVFAGFVAGVTDLLPNAGSVEFAQYQLFLTNAIAARAVIRNGSGRTTIAVLDTGCDLSHFEFLGSSVLAGADYVQGTGSVADDFPGGHGTGAVGLLASSVDGGRLAGLVPGFNVTVHKVCGSDGFCSLDSVVLGIIGALNGNSDSDISTAEIPRADVINIGFSFASEYETLARAVFEADRRGVVVVAPAGNNGRSAEAAQDRYPAGYSTVIAVGATDLADQAAPFSNRSLSLKVVAPGVDLLVTAPANTYVFVNGSSFASVQVSAAAAWLLDLESGLTPSAVQQRISLRGDSLPFSNGFGSASVRRLNFLSVVTNETHAPEPYLIRDHALVEATGVAVDTLVAGQTGQSENAATAEAFSGENVYWYGYFAGQDPSFELIDGDQRTALLPESVAISSIDLFLEFLRGIDLGELSASFTVMQQAVFEMPDLGGERRVVEIVASAAGVESDARPLIFNPLKKGYNIIGYKNFDSAVTHFLEDEGDAFNPQQADIQLFGSGGRPEINWTGVGDANRVQVGSSLNPNYFVTSEEGENEIPAPVRVGACLGNDALDQVCGDDITLPEQEIVRILVGVSGPGGESFAFLDLIYVP